VGALELRRVPSAAPPRDVTCRELGGTRAAPAAASVGTGAIYLRAADHRVPVGLTRFSEDPTGVPVGSAGRAWSRLDIPVDEETDDYPWILRASGPGRVCAESGAEAGSG
jgi:hypothetical protein